MLNGMSSRYKKFRSYLIKTRFEGCNLKLLRDIIQRKNGKELHHQEQSLLLGFINTLVKRIKTATPAKIKHDFIEAYDEVVRPIIGIDEATDFSVCDIYAMQSLLTRDFYSLTLCGDMMQRLTEYGLKSWDELNGVVPNPTVVEMKTSYRQSKKLLEVARQLYQDTLNYTPNYKAFMKSNKVPAPLVYSSEDEFSKVEWISKRISEVYRAYGEQLPSIAIFVNDKGYIPKFAENLQNQDFFAKNKIKVLDGTIESNKTMENHINVYPIDVVKGMEFDVVFFHNIDNSSVNIESLKRYIYVGVSRAAFFLGITLSEQKHEICKYFEKNKDWFNI
jgi:DNA helicase IV